MCRRISAPRLALQGLVWLAGVLGGAGSGYAQDSPKVSPLFDRAGSIAGICRQVLRADPIATSCDSPRARDDWCLQVVEEEANLEELLVRCQPGASVTGLCTARRPPGREEGLPEFPVAYRTVAVEVGAAGKLVAPDRTVSLKTLAGLIAQQEGVEYVEPNCRFQALRPEHGFAGVRSERVAGACDCAEGTQVRNEFDDTLFRAGRQWALDAVHAQSAWPFLKSGPTIAPVGVMDFGVDLDHEDLSASLWKNPAETPGNGTDDAPGNGYVDDVHGHAFYPESCRDPAGPQADCQPDDVSGHGSPVAGVIGATAGNGTGVVGVAFGAPVMSLRVFDEFELMDYKGFADAITYAARNKAGVLNISLYASAYDPDGLVSLALDETADKVLIVVSAGNRRLDLCDAELSGDDHDVFLAANNKENMMFVMATGVYEYPDISVAMHSWSNFGDCIVDIAAPGACICTTSRLTGEAPQRYGIGSHTTIAAPHVSGAAVILRSMPAFASCSPSEIQEILVENAKPVPVGGALTSNRAGGTLSLAFLEDIDDIPGHACIKKDRVPTPPRDFDAR